jgi:hypothetical protein
MQWRDADLMAEFNHTRPTASPSATLLCIFYSETTNADR